MTSKEAQSIVLLSGGIDSTLCVHLLKNRGDSVRCMFVDFGQSACTREAAAARAVTDHYCVDLQTIRLDTGRNFSTGEILGRNAFLVFTALVSSGFAAGKIVLGIHQGTQYFDCSAAFASSLDVLLSEHSDGTVRLGTPILKWNKSEIFEYCKREGVPIWKTYSCEFGTQPSCGKCRSCLDRLGIDASTEALS